MNKLGPAVDRVIEAQKATKKPLAIILAGHNGSGKSTMWRKVLSDQLQMPLINADRMMLSVLPEANSEGKLADWARELRDTNEGWMRVAQRGVQAFVAHAMQAKVPFAMETVFSHWVEHDDGRIESKIDQIREMQAAGYFVLLLFVGLANSSLSILRVQTRVAENGHDVEVARLTDRFPRTQKAIKSAMHVADATILLDNSRSSEQAFTVCVVRQGPNHLFDIRSGSNSVPKVMTEWLNIVCP
ncbi:zeta toxin family protein [Roseinatronobacter alkalisoli]|uniref:Zeta toxin family protein n=1 Tax=Roseinatronobacter alkalisoli TaxID=3028235 RepID=A0ABT5TEG7_9RHOB|nr:zeta toxin family protein [Roseinatronobacter sp. HJB301]MDD7973514.1 zeta toxin family protein [Roseinatronobacter sp. HJB301]